MILWCKVTPTLSKMISWSKVTPTLSKMKVKGKQSIGEIHLTKNLMNGN